MSSTAANKPSELEAQYNGQVRTGTGYAYWTTSEEDEVAVDSDIRQREASGDLDEASAESASKPKKKRDFRAIKTVARLLTRLVLVLIVVAAGYFIFTFVQVYNGASDDQTQEAGAIVVLGAAQFDGTPSPVFEGRLDHAFNLWSRGEAPVIITTGSKQEDDRFTEGYAGYVYLLEKGVPDEDLVTIVNGSNTYEQLSASAIEIANLEDSNVLLVSDGYHSKRLLGIADEVGITAYVSPTSAQSSLTNYFRESAAVAIGRITGYRRLSSITSEQ